MAFKVIEETTVGKFNDPARCEDVIFKSDDYYAVIDGSSIGAPVNGKPSGKLIAEAIAEGLKTCPAGLSMEDATKHINQHVRTVFGYEDSDAVMNRGPRPAASVAIFSVARNELWAYGDTMLMVDGQEMDLTKKIDHLTTDLRCAFVEEKLGEGMSPETIMTECPDFAHVKPILDTQQTKFLNRADEKEYGYANIDGADQVIMLVRVIDLSGAKEIIMATDGWTELKPTIAESEAHLAHIIAVEPTMHKLSRQVKGMRPGQASFDDRAYLKLERI